VAVTQGAAAGDKDAERKAAFDAIDFEIAESRATHQGSGWTLWAVLAALAANVWGISDVLKTAEAIAGHVVVRLFFLGAVSLDCIILLGLILGLENPLFPPRRDRRVPHRRLGPQSSGGEVAVSAVRNVVLLWIVLSVWPDAAGWARKASYVFLALPFVGLLFLALVIPLHMPQTVGSSALQVRTTKGLIGVIVGIGFAVLFGYTSAFLKAGTRPTVAEFRLAGLLVVLTFLLAMVARLSKPSPRLATLVDLRRDLGFGRLTPEVALRRLDTIVEGRRSVDLVEEATARVRSATENVKQWDQVTRESADLLERQRELVGTVPKAAVDEWWRLTFEPLQKSLGRLVKAQKRYRRRLRILTMFDPEAATVATTSSKELLQEAHETAEGLARQLVKLIGQRKALLGEGERASGSSE
jgi:hypothetical protein